MFPFGFKISNLVFVDDCLLFGKATAKGARNVLVNFERFCNVSGQQINFSKSSLYFSNNMTIHLRNEIVNIMHIKHKNTIGKYIAIHNIVF